MRPPWKKRQPRQRGTKTLAKRLAAVFSDADTYVMGGIAALSIGAAVVVGAIFGLAIGAGAGLAVGGLCIFGVGIWLLPPRVVKGAD